MKLPTPKTRAEFDQVAEDLTKQFNRMKFKTTAKALAGYWGFDSTNAAYMHYKNISNISEPATATPIDSKDLVSNSPAELDNRTSSTGSINPPTNMPQKEAAYIAIFLHAYLLHQTHKHHDPIDTLDLANSAHYFTCHAVGFDIAEDETWSSCTTTATGEEIAEYNIDQLLKRCLPEVQNQQKLFSNTFDTGDIEDWREIATQQPDSFHVTTDEQVMEHYSTEMAEKMLELEVRQAAFMRGDYSIDAIRIR